MSSTSVPSSGSVDAAALCNSITPAELSTLSGLSFDTATPSGSAGSLNPPRCSWKMQATPGALAAVSLDQSATVATTKTVFAGGTDVTGVGSAAYFVKGPAGTADLYIQTRAGQLMVQTGNVAQPNFDVAAHQAGNIAIARQVMQRVGIQ